MARATGPRRDTARASAALTAEGAAAGGGPMRAVHLAGVIGALGAGVVPALSLKCLAELALRLVEVGLGWSLLRGSVGSLRGYALRGGALRGFRCLGS